MSIPLHKCEVANFRGMMRPSLPHFVPYVHDDYFHGPHFPPLPYVRSLSLRLLPSTTTMASSCLERWYLCIHAMDSCCLPGLFCQLYSMGRECPESRPNLVRYLYVTQILECCMPLGSFHLASQIVLGSGIGIPASTLCITRRLYNITKIQRVSTSWEDVSDWTCIH
jgi:hypothetical protein